jgi:hypothetical protein
MHVSSLNFQGTKTKDSYLVYETFDHFCQMLPWCIVVLLKTFYCFGILLIDFRLDLLVAIL